MSQKDELIAELEQAIADASEEMFVLKLYVSGSSTRSARAIANVRTICETHIPGRYDLEIIDVFQQPELAAQHQLIAAPTLIKEQPKPPRRPVGDMSNEDRVLLGLNIERKTQ